MSPQGTTDVTSVAIDHLSFQYPGTADAAIRDANLEIPEGSYLLVAGPSGSGKSTLLRCINGLVPNFSGGRFGGQVSIRGQDTRLYGPRALSRTVGFVFQDPESQLITNRVEDELAFGMEQLGVPPLIMRKRVEEVLDLLGIAPLRHRDPATLSGGERQRVAVAAALAIQPKILVLDEPTSQLDPWGADDVLTALTRLNEDLGLTIVLAEHRLERVIGHIDRIRMIESDGSILDGEPADVLARCSVLAVPPLVQLGRTLGWPPMPMTIKEGRAAVAADLRRPSPPVQIDSSPTGPSVVSVRKLSASFGKRNVLREIDLEIRPGELVALMGRNGSGKTTLLRTIVGFHKPESGKIDVAGSEVAGPGSSDQSRTIGYLPQRPSSLLFRETVREELDFTLKYNPRSRIDPDQLLHELELDDVVERNPRDLSVGQQERVALAAVLIADPRVLLLDEPTRGMDYQRKRTLTAILKRLREKGTAIVVATHDVEFVANLASRVVLVGDGRIVADGSPRDVLSGSLTFATQINKLYGDGFLTVDDVIAGLAPVTA